MSKRRSRPSSKEDLHPAQAQMPSVGGGVATLEDLRQLEKEHPDRADVQFDLGEALAR